MERLITPFKTLGGASLGSSVNPQHPLPTIAAFTHYNSTVGGLYIDISTFWSLSAGSGRKLVRMLLLSNSCPFGRLQSHEQVFLLDINIATRVIVPFNAAIESKKRGGHFVSSGSLQTNGGIFVADVDNGTNNTWTANTIPPFIFFQPRTNIITRMETKTGRIATKAVKNS